MDPKEKNLPPRVRTLKTREIVREHTETVRQVVVPEVALNLVTPDCPLWSASPEEAAIAGFPDPYWAFCWPGGQALARFVLDHPSLVHGQHVLDFGAGSGVCGIAAMLSGASACTAADIDPIAQVAIGLNAEINGVHLNVTGKNVIGTNGPWEVVLVGDMFYDADLSTRLLPWLEGLAQNGVTVLIGDPERGFLERTHLHPVGTYRVCAEVDPDGSLRVDADVYVLQAR